MTHTFDEIPAEVRQETMTAALRGQQAFCDLFDAVEAGDLVRAAAAQIEVQRAAVEVNGTLRPLVVKAIMSLPASGIQAAMKALGGGI